MHRTLIVALLLFVSSAFAAGNAASDEHKSEAHTLAPATIYDGNLPVDLSNGRVGNNGTFGMTNTEYEAMAAGELTAPGLLAAPYSYKAKDSFIRAIKDRLRFYDEAVVNLEDKSNMNNKPEVAQYAEKLLPEIKNRLDQAKKALKSAAGANEKEWRNAEDGARAAFVNLKTTYESFMKPATN